MRVTNSKAQKILKNGLTVKIGDKKPKTYPVRKTETIRVKGGLAYQIVVDFGEYVKAMTLRVGKPDIVK